MRNKVKPGATFKLSEDEPAQNAKVGQFRELLQNAAFCSFVGFCPFLLNLEVQKRDAPFTTYA